MTWTAYRHLVVDDAKVPLDANEIEAVEDELGAPLPLPFREFLNATSGGTLEYSVRLAPGPGSTEKSEEIMFCDLFHAGKDGRGGYGDGTLIGEIRNHRSFVNIPLQVLPFARDGGDSTVYLDLTKEGNGRVFAFVFGLPAWTGLRQESGLVEVAPSFDAYVSLLHLDEAEAITLLEEAVESGNENHVEASRDFLDLALPGWRERYPELAGINGHE